MITPSFNLTATERVLPKLALDFTTANLDSRITFTRTTGTSNPATYVNSSGVITSATNNQPRFDYDPITLACKGLLIEESRTNLAYPSNMPTSTTQTTTGNMQANGTTQITSGVSAPDGSTNGFTVSGANQSGNSNGANNVRILAAATSIGTYSVSFYIKTNTTTTTVTVREASSATSKATVTTGSWSRVTFTFTTTLTNQNVIIYSDGTAFDCFGVQLEAGAFPTSYIPTTSAALTRNADVATMTGTNFSSWWTATTGSATVSVIPKTISGIRPIFRFDDNTADNIISLRGNSANPELYIKATTDQSQIDAGTIVANTAYKLSGAWNTNSCAAAQNGASSVDDTSATIPTVTQARIGSDGTNYANAWIQKISYWPQRLINAEVQAFSK